jgi:hypothetical protein
MIFEAHQSRHRFTHNKIICLLLSVLTLFVFTLLRAILANSDFQLALQRQTTTTTPFEKQNTINQDGSIQLTDESLTVYNEEQQLQLVCKI